MKSLFEQADEIPVTLLVALAYVTLAFLTDPYAPTYEQLVAHGAARGFDVVDGQPWRLVTHAFVHGAWWHWAMNLYALLAIGPLLERSVGSVRFAAIYLVAAIGGGVVGTLWHDPRAPLVGGSGALFGMDGALLALLALGGRTPTELLGGAGARNLMGTIAVNFAVGFLFPFISNAAHLGGLLAGFAVTWFAIGRPASGQRRSRALGLASLALYLGATFAAVFPVWRWDFLLVRWEAGEGERRDELRRAFAVAYWGREDALRSEAEMQGVQESLQELRAVRRR